MARVETTPSFDREMKRLAARHPVLVKLYARALLILASDSRNQSGRHNTLKLAGIPPGEGQYRLRLRRFRFRYDVLDQTVVLVSVSLRREKTYG
jgi:mRNA-degrading endonuclease RelE of RelBE toxin-antitoxin system